MELTNEDMELAEAVITNHYLFYRLSTV